MKIGIDLDDTLGQSMPALIEFLNYTRGTNIKIENIKSYNLLDLIGGTKEEVLQELEKFHTSTYGKNIKPIIDAKETLEKLKINNELYVISARSDDMGEITEKWIENNFPNIFFKIYLANQFLRDNPVTTKKIVCNNLNIDIFIDDNLEYVTDCAMPNRRVFLLDYPWNQTDKLPEGVMRVYSWKEIDKLINSL